MYSIQFDLYNLLRSVDVLQIQKLRQSGKGIFPVDIWLVCDLSINFDLSLLAPISYFFYYKPHLQKTSLMVLALACTTLHLLPTCPNSFHKLLPHWERDPPALGNSILFFKNSNPFLPLNLHTYYSPSCSHDWLLLTSGRTSQTILFIGTVSTNLCSLSFFSSEHLS